MDLEGINKKILEKLENAGFTIESLSISTSEELSSEIDITIEEAKKSLRRPNINLGYNLFQP